MLPTFFSDVGTINFPKEWSLAVVVMLDKTETTVDMAVKTFELEKFVQSKRQVFVQKLCTMPEHPGKEFGKLPKTLQLSHLFFNGFNDLPEIQ